MYTVQFPGTEVADAGSESDMFISSDSMDVALSRMPVNDGSGGYIMLPTGSTVVTPPAAGLWGRSQASSS
jgi:hypothetical protein